jgi:hypothetical protein
LNLGICETFGEGEKSHVLQQFPIDLTLYIKNTSRKEVRDENFYAGRKDFRI